jgi:hypothetical protein
MKIFSSAISISCIVLALLSCSSDSKEDSPLTPDDFRKDSQLYVNPDVLGNAYATVDVSPMDMSYYPVDYPKLKMANPAMEPPVARVIYSRPHLSGRQLFHDVLKYGEAWRLGANESTEIQFYRDVSIQNKKIPAGRYSMYSVLGETTWIIAINSEIDSWGLKQDPKKDVGRFEIPISHGNPELEYFTIIFEKAEKGANLLFGWDDVIGRLLINY